MEPTEILEQLFDAKVLSILKFFIKNEGNEYYLRETARSANVSAASTYRILSMLTKLGLLELREIKTAKLYRLAGGKTTDFIKGILEVDVIDRFIDQAGKVENIEEIILLGERGKTKSNILMLGSGIDNARIKFICGDLRERYGYAINTMTLTREQFEQMSAMGLYPGSKKTLFKRV